VSCQVRLVPQVPDATIVWAFAVLKNRQQKIEITKNIFFIMIGC
jgi:hypothetical protein